MADRESIETGSAAWVTARAKRAAEFFALFSIAILIIAQWYQWQLLAKSGMISSETLSVFNEAYLWWFVALGVAVAFLAFAFAVSWYETDPMDSIPQAGDRDG